MSLLLWTSIAMQRVSSCPCCVTTYRCLAWSEVHKGGMCQLDHKSCAGRRAMTGSCILQSRDTAGDMTAALQRQPVVLDPCVAFGGHTKTCCKCPELLLLLLLLLLLATLSARYGYQCHEPWPHAPEPMPRAFTIA